MRRTPLHPNYPPFYLSTFVVFSCVKICARLQLNSVPSCLAIIIINGFIRLASVFSSNKILSRLKFVELTVRLATLGVST
jgi:hypothetical protein